MTKLLAQAFEKASELPEEMQDELARELHEDLAGEARWDETLERSAEGLDQMAEQALKEYRAGRTRETGHGGLGVYDM